MHQQSTRQLQDRLTSLGIVDVLDVATRFFASGGGVYSVFLEKRGPSHAVFRGQGGEEIVIGAQAVPGGTRVSGASYLFDQQVARLLNSLPPASMAHVNPVVASDAATAGATNAGATA